MVLNSLGNYGLTIMHKNKRQAAVAPHWPAKRSLKSKLRGHKGGMHTEGPKKGPLAKIGTLLLCQILPFQISPIPNSSSPLESKVENPFHSERHQKWTAKRFIR